MVCYDFKWISDYGKRLVMVDALSDGMLADGFAIEFLTFWQCPVTYTGPKETPL